MTVWRAVVCEAVAMLDLFSLPAEMVDDFGAGLEANIAQWDGVQEWEARV